MATALTQFRPQSQPDGRKYIHHLPLFSILLAFIAPFSALDAKAIATCSKSLSVITTPNMTFVPEPHVDAEELRPRADGRFGTADCFQWPQEYAKEFMYAVCIPRREFHQAPDDFSWAWYTPTLEDIDTVPTENDVAGKLKQEQSLGLLKLLNIAQGRYDSWKKTRVNKKDILPKLILTLRHSIYQLMNDPHPWRDVVAVVAQAQRLFLDIIAFLDYWEVVGPRVGWPNVTPHPVRADWMGCFTTDSRVCNELFCAGVPVWYIRFEFSVTATTIIEKPVVYTFPDHIIRAQFSVPRKTVQPFSLLHAGPGGKDRHVQSRQFYESTPSLSTSTSASGSSHVGKAQIVAQTKKEARKQVLQQSSTQGRANPSTSFLNPSQASETHYILVLKKVATTSGRTRAPPKCPLHSLYGRRP